jgi:metallo-beta-lactamase class B
MLQRCASTWLFAWLLGLSIVMGCAGSAGAADEKSWTAPLAPFRIADNLYYVGSQELTAYLIATPKGLILLDAGVPENAPMVLNNIHALGFDPHQIKYLLNSHAHFDHAGGLAAIKRLSGAQMIASRGDAPVLESGGRADFFFGPKPQFPNVKVDRLIDDGGEVSLGGTTITAHLTPGHTKGCTTWTMPLRVDGRTRQALFLCSLTILPRYRLTGDRRYPQMAADFTRSYSVLHGLPCEVFLASHGSFFDLTAKRQVMLDHPDAPNPFVDPAGCRAFFARGEADFHQRLEAVRAR